VVKQISDFAARVFASLIYVLRTRYALRTPSTASLFMGFAHVIPDAFSNGIHFVQLTFLQQLRKVSTNS
jgi:hypothetical protein